jgi:hypothetical protein
MRRTRDGWIIGAAAALFATLALGAAAQTRQWYAVLEDTRCLTPTALFAEIFRIIGGPMGSEEANTIRTPDDVIIWERYHGFQAEDVSYHYLDVATVLRPAQLRVVRVAGFAHNLMFINDYPTCELLQASVTRPRDRQAPPRGRPKMSEASSDLRPCSGIISPGAKPLLRCDEPKLHRARSTCKHTKEKIISL